MEKTKEMKQKVKVVILPTEDKETSALVKSIDGLTKQVQPVNGGYVESDQQFLDRIELLNNDEYTGQHLYFTSDEEIKEGDWCIITTENANMFFKQFNKNLEYIFCKKIIATTDTSIREHDDTVPYPKTKEALPQIPQSFIEEYARQGGIDKVELEYNTKTLVKPNDVYFEQVCTDLKLTSNNEVIIHLIEEKMYTKKDMTTIAKKAMRQGEINEGCTGLAVEFDEWIKENL